MKLVASLCLAAAAFLLAACASLSEDQCRAGNWRQIGVADGAEGRLPSYFARHREACAEYGIAPDRKLWRAGWTQGLRLYCRPAKAYEIGRAGRSIAPVCTEAERVRMQAPWLQGRRYHEIAEDIDHLERERRDLWLRLADLKGVDGAQTERIGLRREISFIDSRISILRLRLLSYSRWR